MTVDTHLDDALDQVGAEREQIEVRLAALDRFETRVRRVEPVSPTGGTATPVPDGGTTATAALARDGPTDRCDRVREAFAETVGETVDEPTLSAMCEALTDEVTLALSGKTAHRFTPAVRRSVLAAAEERQAELGAVRKALGLEADSVRSAADRCAEITAWLASADETPLLSVGFEELRARHERLAAFREQCDRLARQRQALLDRTVSEGGAAGVQHRSLVDSLYGEFPTDHPVLSAAATLDGVCADCQRAVRDHLARRV